MPLPLPPSADFAPFSAAVLRLLDDPGSWSGFGRNLPDQEGVWESCVVLDRAASAPEKQQLSDALLELAGVERVWFDSDPRRLHVVWTPSRVRPSAWLDRIQGQHFRPLPARDFQARRARRQGLQAAQRRWQIAALLGALILLSALPGYGVLPAALQTLCDRVPLRFWQVAGAACAFPLMLYGNGALLRSGWQTAAGHGPRAPLLAAVASVGVWAISSWAVLLHGPGADPQGGAPGYFDSYAWLVFALLYVHWLALRSVDRCAGVLEATENTLPESVERQNPGGNFERVGLLHIRVGDHLRVQPGETFLADGVIEQGATMVNEAPLTGAARAVYRRYGDTVLAGSGNVSAIVHIRVLRLPAQTQLDAMQALMREAGALRPLSRGGADRIAMISLLLACGCGVVLALLAMAGAFEAARFGLSEAFLWLALALSAPAIASPLALLAAARRLRREGVLVRHLIAMERLADVSTVIFGKTGTLTQDTMVLDEIECRPGERAAELLHKAAAIARHSLHPASRALCAALGTPRAGAHAYRGPEWTCTEVIDTPGAGLEGTVRSHEGEHPLRLGSSAFCGVPPIPDARFAVYLSDARGWLATFTLDEALRAQAALVVTRLNQARVAVHMLSGDKADAVRRMARVLGIAQARGGCAPNDKLQAVQTLQSNAEVVAMVGDGMSDGPALAGADVSIALGNALAPVLQASDIVVPVARVGLVADAVVLSRKTRRVARQNGLALLLAYAAGALLAAGGVKAWVPLPLWALVVAMASNGFALCNAWRLTRKTATQRNQL